MQTYLWIALGGAVGGAGRYWCSTAITRRWGSRLPWGTLTVNVGGCFALGLLVAGLSGGGTTLSEDVALLLFVGVLGSFTTVSSFGLETLGFLQAQEWWRGGLNILLTLLLCLTATGLGLALGTIPAKLT